MNNSFNIRINTISKAKDFVKVASTFEIDVELRSDNYVVDGKSILGVFSLDLSRDLEARLVPSKNGHEVTDEIVKSCADALKEFIV